MKNNNYLTLEEIQKVYLELLIEFDKLCNKNNLRYDLCGGSLLGAVRHKGFIPWDNDIDVCMPRPDYEKLINLKKNSLIILPKDRDIISDRDKSFARHFSRYIRKDVGRVQKVAEEYDCPYIGLDIFTIDGITQNKLLLNIQFFLIKNIKRLLLTSVQRKNTSRKGVIAAKIKNIYRPLLKLIGSFNLARLLDFLLTRCKYSTAKYVGCINGVYGKKEKWLKEDMLPQEKYLFEGHYFNSFKNYHIYLTNLYSNYMELPPLDKQNPHCNDAYWITKK